MPAHADTSHSSLAAQVHIDGKLVHSKLDTGCWPEFGDIVDKVKLARESRSTAKAGETGLAPMRRAMKARSCVVQ